MKDALKDSVQVTDVDISNLSKQDGPTSIPYCVDVNPFIRANIGWVPKYIYLAPRSWYGYLAIYMALVTLISCTFNGIVIVATIKNKAVRQPLNYVIVNLAVAEFFSALVAGFFITFANVEGYFFWGQTLCKIEGYLVTILSLAGLNTIAVMAFERFLVVCKPFGNVPFGPKASAAGLVLAWGWSIVWNTPPLLFWDGYINEGFGTACAPNWYTRESGPRLFVVLFFLFCFCLPLGTITGCYGALIINLRKIAKQSSVSGSKNPEGEVLKMVILMVSAFVGAWLPYACFAMYNVTHPNNQIPLIYGVIPSFFAKSGPIYNPLIYIGFNRQFRDVVIRMFCNGKNPWSDDMSGASSISSTTSQVTTISTANKVAPA